jgi:iron-sulfur cluster assembly protein
MQKSFRITEDAADQILQSMSQTDPSTGSLRIAAKRRPDGSIDYAMGFDEAIRSDPVLGSVWLMDCKI